MASPDFGNEVRPLSEIAALPRSAGAEGQKILLSTHRPDQVVRPGAEVALIRGGRILGQGSAWRGASQRARRRRLLIGVRAGATVAG